MPVTLAFSDSPLRDPFIPDGERSVLSVKIDDTETSMRGRVEIGGENGEVYNIFTSTDKEKLELSMHRRTMMTFSIRTIKTIENYTIDSSTTVEGDPMIPADEIRMLDTTGLVYSLRGYPFTDPRELKITFLTTENDGESDYELGIDLAGRERLDVAGRRIECYRLELSFKMSGVFSVFTRLVPRTKLWYSVESPHYLVRYEGQNGPPGTPLTVMELIDYSGWN